MKRLILIVIVTLAAGAAWAGLVLAGASEGWWRQPIVASTSPDTFLQAAREKADEELVGNVALVLVEEGEVAGTYFASRGESIDGDTLFQVASLSKWLAAFGVMTLVEDGRISLDVPVSDYLTRWRLPESGFDNNDVTVRRLLSHTAGLGDGLGYMGFEAREGVQTLEASLTQAADASPGANGAVQVVQAPGEGWMYSGGGYTLLQLIVEEVTGQSFNAYMEAEVFDRLGMEETTFDLDQARQGSLAENYRTDGTSEPFRYYTSLAATSAFTSANDLVRFVRAQIPALTDSGDPVLQAQTLEAMRQPHGAQLGADIWGLGTMLYARNGQGDYIIGHDGNNEPAINTAARVDPETGDAIIILETGNNLLATRLAGDWVFWKTGNVDFLTFASELGATLDTVIIGAIIILVIAFLVAVRAWRLPALLRR